MGTIMKFIRPAAISFALFTVLLGVAYTGAITGISGLLLSDSANGTVITLKTKDGETIAYGSALLAQEFTKPEYLIGRPSGATNLSPTGYRERELVAERVEAWHALEPDNRMPIPVDLVTASGSGADPYISPEGAEYQVARIARTRGISKDAVLQAIKQNTTGRFLGVFGEARVNVLRVNLTLDGLL